ncbi:hypothetical protein DPMN_033790 [Dreissena polymorpha]|uniref:Uncharacterized protein n=1 Tax=Dreissena polymorpha TaxID=45954 RepID=A0A9D4RLB2_DREPO|nr:hypothetical protein DPMN_033790 [Dreissena polymorpha]
MRNLSEEPHSINVTGPDHLICRIDLLEDGDDQGLGLNCSHDSPTTSKIEVMEFQLYMNEHVGR